MSPLVGIIKMYTNDQVPPYMIHLPCVYQVNVWWMLYFTLYTMYPGMKIMWAKIKWTILCKFLMYTISMTHLNALQLGKITTLLLFPRLYTNYRRFINSWFSRQSSTVLTIALLQLVKILINQSNRVLYNCIILSYHASVKIIYL